MTKKNLILPYVILLSTSWCFAQQTPGEYSTDTTSFYQNGVYYPEGAPPELPLDSFGTHSSSPQEIADYEAKFGSINNSYSAPTNDYMPIKDPGKLKIATVSPDEARRLGWELVKLWSNDSLVSSSEYSVYDKAKALIEAGADVNTEWVFYDTPHGGTLLTFAAEKAFANLALLALRAGADPKKERIFVGHGALKVASYSLKEEIVYDSKNRPKKIKTSENPVYQLLIDFEKAKKSGVEFSLHGENSCTKLF